MRAVLLVLAACGGAAPPVTSPEPVAVALPPSEPCEPRTGGYPEGLHDRVQFQDPATEKVGFKTKAGAVVIPAQYEMSYGFTPGGVAAVIDGTTPFVHIDPAGKVVAKAYAFDNGPDYYQEGFARIVGADGKIGFLGETSGKVEIPPQYDDAAPFCNGKAQVRIGAEAFEIDARGQRVK